MSILLLHLSNCVAAKNRDKLEVMKALLAQQNRQLEVQGKNTFL